MSSAMVGRRRANTASYLASSARRRGEPSHAVIRSPGRSCAARRRRRTALGWRHRTTARWTPLLRITRFPCWKT